MQDVMIMGAGMTSFGKFRRESLRSLAERALAEALEDASLSANDIDAAFFANAAAGLITGQEMIRGQVALRHTGLLGLPIVNVENACASASTAVHLAFMAVASGQSEVAVAIGVEKMFQDDTRRSLGALQSGIDVEDPPEIAIRSEAGGSIFMDVYADLALRYMERSLATDRDFAEVAVKNHKHGSLNPKAQYRNEVTLDEVLASRRVSGPLTLLMCSPIGDGAAAVVLCSENHARKVEADGVRIAASVLVSGGDQDGPTTVERAAHLAYERSGIGPADFDVVELHDAAAPAELLLYEELGLCKSGQAADLLRTGDTRLGGRVPVNVSGGLISKGHPIGATGLAQLVELTDQLRGRAGERQVSGARVALAENGGGYLGRDLAAAVVTILRR